MRVDRPAAAGHTLIMIRCTTLLGTLVALPLMAAVNGPALAQSTDWFDTVGGDVRLVVAPPQRGDDDLRGVIEVRLEAGWKTYWRDPGSSGIPPQMSVAGSAGLAEPIIHYPAPVWIENPYGDFAGYDRPVALPFTLKRTANGKARLVASVFMGICEDICIPVQADFRLDVDYASGSTLDAMRVEAAHAALPPDASDALEVTVEPDPPAGHALVTVFHPVGSPPSLFVHAPDGTQFKPPRVVERAEGRTRFALEPVKPEIDGRTVEAIVTVSAGDEARERTHTLHIAGQGG